MLKRCKLFWLYKDILFKFFQIQLYKTSKSKLLLFLCGGKKQQNLSEIFLFVCRVFDLQNLNQRVTVDLFYLL